MSSPGRRTVLTTAAGVLGLGLTSGCSDPARDPRARRAASSQPPSSATASSQPPSSAPSQSAPSVPASVRPAPVHGTAPAAHLREVQRLLPEAQRRVSRVWGDTPVGGGVRRPERVELPATTDELARLTGTTAPQAISAVTTPDAVLVLSPLLWSRTSATGRLVVLTHELTHVRLGTSVPTGLPGWLVEGSAELTAYAATGLPLTRACPGLARRVRAGEQVRRPPTDRELRPQSTRDLSRAYEQAHAWCRWWVGRHGQTAFVREVRRGVITGHVTGALRPTATDATAFEAWLGRETAR